MLNLNHYTAAAVSQMAVSTRPIWRDREIGWPSWRLLWRTPVSGQPIGCEHDGIDEILAVWYLSHASF